MTATRMSNVDAAWLGMDAPDNLMMITAVLWFRAPVDWDRLTETVGARLIRTFPKFSQRPLPSASPFEQPVWTSDPDFDLRRHLLRVDLGDTGDRAALAELVSGLLSQPLDMHRSPWQFHLVDGYGQGAALVARLHHCIADGIALASVLLSLTDETAEPAEANAVPPALATSVRRPGLARRVTEGTSDVASVAGIDFGRMWRRPRQAFRAARFVGYVVFTGARVVFATRDPRTRFRGRLGKAKVAAWTDELDLASVKRVAAALDATVNDVLLAVTAGALRRHLLMHGETPGDLRIFVPVNLRPADEPVPRDLGNRFGLVFIRLPVGEADPCARVRKVHERMATVKSSAQAVATFAILNIVGALPAWGHALAVRILGAKSTAIVTNVPGPRERVFLAGTELDGMVFWVPQAGAVGMGVSILSYAGVVRIGIAADRNLVADPSVLARSVEAELDDLARAAERAAT